MTEQRESRLAVVETRHAMPRVVAQGNWVAVRYDTIGPWYLSRRCDPGAEPVECYVLPSHDPLFGLL